MRSFLRIFRRLLRVQSDKRTPESQSADLQFTSSCAKAKKTLCNANRRRRRWRWSRNVPHRSIAHATPTYHRDASLHPTVPGGEGTRRAPVLGNTQPPRSPRPPFEESIRSFTRRTPGSEDASSVETEVGYPVVGPVTPRTGHQNLRSTLFHQNEVVYSQDVVIISQDVSTNTPFTNIPIIRTFSDGTPSTDVVEDSGGVSTGSQTNPAGAPPVLWLPEMPMSSATEPQEVSQNPQEEQTTQPQFQSAQPSSAGTAFSPYRPVAPAAEASQPSSPQTGHLPKNFYFPSQMRRNRSNTDDSNAPGHRKIAPACRDAEQGPLCSKIGRSCSRCLDNAVRRDSQVRTKDSKVETAQISASASQNPLMNDKTGTSCPDVPDNATLTHFQEKCLPNRLFPEIIQPCLDIISSENIDSHEMLQPSPERVGFSGEMNILGQCLKSGSETHSILRNTAATPLNPQASDSKKHALKMDVGTQSSLKEDLSDHNVSFRISSLQEDSPGHNASFRDSSSHLGTLISLKLNQRTDILDSSVLKRPILYGDPDEEQSAAEVPMPRQSSEENKEPRHQTTVPVLSTMLPPSTGSSSIDRPTQKVFEYPEHPESRSVADEVPMPPVMTDGDQLQAPGTNTPVLLVTVPERESKASTEEQDSVGTIDVRNHLFVKNISEVSVASSVYIGEDGKAAVTRNADSSPQGTSDGTYSQRRELGAKPKVREPLSLRKKMLVINDDSLVKDRSSAIDDGRNVVARGHRVIGERRSTRGWTRNQISSRKNTFGDPHRSPGRCPRNLDSRRHFETSRQSGQPAGELRSIWINPQTEQSFPNSNSTIDVAAGFSQTIILSHPPRSPATPTSRPSSKSPGIGAEACLFLVECVICKCKLQSPVRQCIEGHGFCEQCSSQGDSCPVCRSSVPESSKMRDLIRNIRFACKNSLAGCKETYGMEDHSKDESRCLYRQRTCPLSNRSGVNCAWKGVRSGIRGHMKKQHGHPGTIHPFRTFFPVEAFDSRLWVDRAYDAEVIFVENEIFELHKVFDTRKSCVWGLLRRIVAKDLSQRYVYSIKFQPKNIRGSLTFNIEALEGSEELNKAFELGKRFKLYLDSFSQEPLEVFSIHLRVVPKSATMFHNVL